MRFPNTSFFPQGQLTRDAVCKIGLHQNSLEFSAGRNDPVIGGEIVNDYGCKKSIHGV